MGDDGLTVVPDEVKTTGGIVIFKAETGIELAFFIGVEDVGILHVHDVVDTDEGSTVGTGMNKVALVFRNGLQEVTHLVGRDDETLVGSINGDKVDIPIGNKVIARNLQKARIVETEKIILVLGNDTGAGGNLGRRDEQPSVRTGYEGITGITAHRNELGVDDAALRDGAMNMILRIGIQGNRLHKFSHFQTPELWFMPLSWSCSLAKGQACAWPTLSLTRRSMSSGSERSTTDNLNIIRSKRLKACVPSPPSSPAMPTCTLMLTGSSKTRGRQRTPMKETAALGMTVTRRDMRRALHVSSRQMFLNPRANPAAPPTTAIGQKVLKTVRKSAASCGSGISFITRSFL